MKDKKTEKKYETVKNALENSLKEAKNTTITGEEENRDLEAVIESLSELNRTFKESIEELEKSSEWDKYCFAFLGETTAGKSIIIDTLRIIYDEESRRAEINSQKHSYTEALEKHKDNYSELLKKLEAVSEVIEKREKVRENHKIRRLPKTLEHLGL